MRSAQEMFNLILEVAQADERIRAVILNGSRANPKAPHDIFQDFDIVYLVTEIDSFKQDLGWVGRFGERIIMQLPDDMEDPSPENLGSYTYLMQFADGHRIDLTLYPISRLDEMAEDSLSVLLLEKDGVINPFPPADDSSYWPIPPTAKAFADCCNEFWWVSPYVAKGLWRREITYAKMMLDGAVREQLMKMLVWYIGLKTNFGYNPGKFGKYFPQYLEPELWEMLLRTYANADFDRNWKALMVMGQLFRKTAVPVAAHFNFPYPHQDDLRVSAFLLQIRQFPPTATSFPE